MNEDVEARLHARHAADTSSHVPNESQSRCSSAGFAGAILPWGEAATSEPEASAERRKGGEAPLRGHFFGTIQKYTVCSPSGSLTVTVFSGAQSPMS